MNGEMTMSDMDLGGVLRSRFGFECFREGQRAVIETVLSGRDCLAVMPTGGGKSLCYQLPAVVRSGVTIVVSPLISLMKDQVDGLVRAGVAAAHINSSLSRSARSERLHALRKGKLDIVYVAPERFRSSRFIEALNEVDVDLMAIDEAHCVSMWGHDFRPDYLQLGSALGRLGNPQVLCLTATATPEVRDDIIDQLGMGRGGRSEVDVVVRGFSRPSLTLAVSRVRGRRDKVRRTHELVSAHRTGIVYCSTRKSVERVTTSLRQAGVACEGYHAGMTDESRRITQERFSSGDVNVVVATNAFGMGIDRADVRTLIHFEVPGSIESYYQEAGRAGRDGEPAHCELLFNHADVRTQEFFIEGSNPSPSLVRRLAHTAVRLFSESGGPVAFERLIAEVSPEGRAGEMAAATGLGVLTRLGLLRRKADPDPDRRSSLFVPGPADVDIDEIDLGFLNEKETRDRARLRRLLAFANERGCRHAAILSYFGDPAGEETCEDRCDNCRKMSGVGKERGRQPTEREWIQIQKALSAVARLSGRFGQTRVAQVLSGSKAQPVRRAGLDRIRSHGTLESLPMRKIRDLLHALEEAGCIETIGAEYPTVRLTDFGHRVMRRRGKVTIDLPDDAPKPARRRSGGALAGDKACEERLGGDERSARLAEALRSWRLEEARRRKKPAYTIFSNATLVEIARTLPADEPALLAVKGIGPAKLEAFGEDILEMVRSSSR
jgi:ATP-dependent DNA helicase RecQ